jgi:hypothetical protein
MNRGVASQMRRRLQRFLPIVLIALVVQILAPIGACWAAAFAASDPLRAIEICHSDPASAPGAADQSGQSRAHDGACAICCVAQANASFDAPQAVAVATAYRDVARVVWRDAAPDISRFYAGSNTRARAPPLSI